MRLRIRIRRAGVVTAAAVAATAAVVTLGGCGSAKTGKVADAVKGAPSSSAPADGFDVEEAVRKADPAPYSVQMDAKTYVGSRHTITISGRANLNAPMTASMRMRSAPAAPVELGIDMEMIATPEGTYGRGRIVNFDTGGRWTKLPAGGDDGAQDFDKYTRMMLDLGPSARKGVEKQGGEPAYRLSGTLTQDMARKADPKLYNNMRTKGLRQIDCDLWVNKAGRVVRLEQWMGAGGQKGHNVVVLKDFGAPVKITAPSASEVKPFEG
ncbi:hypothetical protein [Streptomyces luteireticuli]|uniref:LppX_LprAFG lipoprotein n=1 Tax=Streptomyces luteireticuli TaxID=173858 RepID=A0ABN0YYU6_9ACTN